MHLLNKFDFLFDSFFLCFLHTICFIGDPPFGRTTLYQNETPYHFNLKENAGT